VVRGLWELGSGGATHQEGVEGGGHVEEIYEGGLFTPVVCVAVLVGMEVTEQVSELELGGQLQEHTRRDALCAATGVLVGRLLGEVGGLYSKGGNHPTVHCCLG